MFELIKEFIAREDMTVVVLTFFAVVIAVVKNWMVAHQRLRPTYWFMIAYGNAYTSLNTYLAFRVEGQEAIIFLNIPSVWVILMGFKGLRGLKNIDVYE